ncbi:MAG: sugar phosphate isomerase/epimerase [Candidatus Nealsonbacteria bacterium]|nr:sugar phosphate isomerase/epimerase [Candidatus Nealsonbacteria bacterium]
MCRLLAAAPATLCFPGRSPAAEKGKQPFALQYILASSMYGKMKLAEILPEVRKTGAERIDLWPLGHADQREQMQSMGHEKFAELLDRHNVALGMTTRYDLGPLKLQDEMRVLKKFGGRLIVTGSVGPKNLTGAPCKAAVRQFVERMKPHIAVAEETGVTIGIENHANALIHTPDSLRYLGELSPSPRLGVALAPYHLPQDETLLARLIEDLGPKLAHFYAWQYGQGCMQKLPKPQELEQMPGRGRLDFRPLLAALKKIDYSHWTEIFMHPVPRGIPILETAEAVTAEINRARSYLDRL